MNIQLSPGRRVFFALLAGTLTGALLYSVGVPQIWAVTIPGAVSAGVMVGLK